MKSIIKFNKRIIQKPQYKLFINSFFKLNIISKIFQIENYNFFIYYFYLF